MSLLSTKTAKLLVTGIYYGYVACALVWQYRECKKLVRVWGSVLCSESGENMSCSTGTEEQTA